MVGARRAQGVHIIPIDTQAMREGDVQVARRLGADSMREVFKVLRSGGVVAMALDRDLIGNGEPLEFFGQPAPIPIGAVEIAIRAGAAVVPILLFRDRYRVHAVVYPEIRYAPDATQGRRGAQDCRGAAAHLRAGDPRASRAMACPRPHLAGARDAMKICLVSPYDFMHPGGVTEHVRHLSAKLRARGHDVTVLAPSSRVGDDHGIPGYVRIGRSVPVRTNGSVARIALSFHLVRRVRALLDENAFDVVHYHEPLVPVAADHGAALPQRRERRDVPRDGATQPRLLLRQAVPQALLQPAARAHRGERAGARLHRALLRG